MRIDLFIDVVSPYSVFGAAFLDRYQPIWEYKLNIKPVSLGQVMKTQGNRGPAMTKTKIPWLMSDMVRNVKLFQVDFMAPPSNFPGVRLPEGIAPAETSRLTKTLAALTLTRGADHPSAMKVLRAMQAELFVKHGSKIANIDDAFVLSALEKAGLGPDEAAEFVEAGKGEEAARVMEENTTEAIGLGMFGAPYMAVYGEDADKPECFFGSDRFEQMALVFGKPYYGVGE